MTEADADAGALVEALRGLGLVSAEEDVELVPLTGGVSSDVIAVKARRGAFVIKRSIPRLRVAAEWLAPVERASSEVRWLKLVRSIDPRLAPEVIAELPEQHIFVMAYLDQATHPVWKTEMFAGRVDPVFAGRVGADLARIHAYAAARPQLAEAFATDAAFMALRIDPFLLYTADRHPDVADRLRDLAADLQVRKTTLVQGDISPKNILMGPDGPVFLDAECSVWGDGAFDLAFCLTHLLLKSVWLAPDREALLASLGALRDRYLAGMDWEDAGALSRRAAALVGGLLLARVDGKSPAGYLDEAAEAIVRRRAKAILGDQALDLAALGDAWRTGALG